MYQVLVFFLAAGKPRALVPVVGDVCLFILVVQYNLTTNWQQPIALSFFSKSWCQCYYYAIRLYLLQKPRKK